MILALLNHLVTLSLVAAAGALVWACVVTWRAIRRLERHP
jgi:hypothetical protein